MQNMLMQFFTLGGSKVAVSETYFFDIETTLFDHPRYVKCDLGRFRVFFTIFAYCAWGWAGGSQGIGTKPAYAVFHI